MANENRQAAKKNSMLLYYFKRLCKNRLAVVGLIIIVIFLLIALFAPVIATHDPTKIDVTQKLIKPCAEHYFGTDELGRDLFSRVIYGTRLSFYIGLLAVLISVAGGILLGSIAGFFGGRVDNIIMRILDILAGVPSIVLAIVVCAAFGVGLTNAVVALGIATIPSTSRLTRASILSVREMDYIEAARSINCSNAHIILHHILPNSFSPLLVSATMNYAFFILLTASLSFVGLGVQPPSSEWGALISAARNYVRTDAYLIIIPGLFLCLLVMAFNMVGDGLRDALDPKLKD